MATAIREGKLKRVALPEVLADRVQAQILDQRLAPGSQLPTEFELMERYGVGRGAVREAAKILVQRGLADVRPGRGMTVAEPLGEAVTDHLITHLRMSGATPGQLFEVRELLEPAIARAAALRRTDAHVAELRRISDAAGAERSDAQAYLAFDLDFHRALARATGNPFYVLAISAIFLLSRDASLHATGRAATQAEHREILDAIGARASERAAEVALRHLRRVRRSIGPAPSRRPARRRR